MKAVITEIIIPVQLSTSDVSEVIRHLIHGLRSLMIKLNFRGLEHNREKQTVNPLDESFLVIVTSPLTIIKDAFL